jgi:drug/metabolite transporter (DMT)-like permease
MAEPFFMRTKIDPFSCLMMALVGSMWGLHGPAVKLAFASGFTFPQLVFGEYVVGTLVFGAVVLLQRQPWPRDRAFWTTMPIAGVIGCGVPLFLFWAYQLGPVSIGATLLFLYVPFTQLINAVVNRRPPPGRELMSAGLVVSGAALAADFFGAANADDLRGAPYATLAAFCFAVFFVIMSRLGGSGTPALRSFATCALSGAMLPLIAVYAGWELVPAAPAPAVAAAWLLGLGVFGQVIPVFLLVHFGPRTGSGIGSILTATELPVAVLVCAALFGDPLGPAQIGGGALVLAGIALPHLSRGATPPTPQATGEKAGI